MKDLYHNFLIKIAHFQVEHPIYAILILLTLTIAIYGGVSQVRTVASLEQMMPKDVEEIKAFNTLRDNNLGQDMIAIVVEINKESTDTTGINDIRDKQVYEYVSHIKNLVASESDIISVYAFTDVVESIASMQGITSEQIIDDNGDIYNSIIHDQNFENQFSQFVNSDYTKTIIIASTDVSANDPRMNLLSTKIKNDVASAGYPPGIKIEYTGTPLIQQKLGELITKDRADTKTLSTLFVFLITMIIFGTFTSALVPIIIVTISVNFLYGTMGYTDLPISTLAGGVAAMVIGIGIDFAIHIMNKFKYERKKGLKVKESIEMAVVETGTALTATSATTIAAFLAFLIGVMPEMGRFGILMAIGIFYSLIFSLFGLPAILVLEEKLIYFVKNRAKFGVEGELHLEAQTKKNEFNINNSNRNSNNKTGDKK